MLRILFLIFFFALSLTTYAKASPVSVAQFTDQVVLVESTTEKSEKFFDIFRMSADGKKAVSVSAPFASFGWQGICLSLDGSPCIVEFESEAAIKEAVARSSGMRNALPNALPPMTSYHVVSTSSFSFDGQTMVVETKKTIFGSPVVQKYRISKIPILGDKKIDIATPEQDVPARSSFADENGITKKLADAVVQIVGGPADDSELLGPSTSSGTGFFIKSDGLLMTNHHVISSYQECLENLECTLKFRQTKSDGSEIDFSAPVSVLAESTGFDFALLQVHLPAGVQVLSFKIESTKIGPNIITFGYPGDKSKKTEAGDRNVLTYSRGLLVGLSSRAFATSAYIFGGASGSPLLNADDLNLIGILSNGVGNPVAGVGSPGLARPIHLIDLNFGLSDYINGQKQKRVNSLVSQLSKTSEPNVASVVMAKYLNERSFLGLPQIKLLLVGHPSSAVRAEILKGLENMKIVLGITKSEIKVSPPR